MNKHQLLSLSVSKIIHTIDRGVVVLGINRGTKVKGQLAPRCCALDAMIKNYIMVYRRLYTHLGSKNLNTLGLGGGDHNLRPNCRRSLLGHFTPPPCTLRLDTPALPPPPPPPPESAVPMMAINWNQVKSFAHTPGASALLPFSWRS